MTAGDLTASGLTADAIAALPYRENVGVMLLNAAGKVFVGQRLDNRTPAWQMPQGGIDPGEDPRTAALRELHEETGVRPDLVEIVAVSDDWITYPRVNVQFDTPWAPPTPFVMALSEKYPDCAILLEFEEGGMCFEGEIVVKAGDVEYQAERDMKPDFDYMLGDLIGKKESA